MGMNKELFNQLEIIQEDAGRLWSYCVFHKDTTRPNFSISLEEKYLGRYKCWACGKEGWLSKKQVASLSLSNYTVYETYTKKLSLRWLKFTNDCKKNLQRFPLLKIELASQLNVSTKSVDEWGIGFDGRAYTIPMYREDLSEFSRERGICGVQRRFSGGDKRSVLGSRLGFMYSWDYLEDACTLFICEGFSDAINVWDLGFQSVARPNCHFTTGFWYFLTEIGYESVVIIPDNDDVGISGANKLCDEIGEVTDCIVYEFDGAKDIRELIKIKSKSFVKQELMRYV